MFTKQLKITALFLALSFSVIVPKASALLVFEGELSTATGGLVGQQNWASDVTLTWKVEQQVDLTSWKYTYSFYGEEGALLSPSHFGIEISPQATANDFSNFNGGSLEFGIFDDTKFGAPGTITNGLKLDYEAAVYMFLSTKAPVWGDFAAKGARVNAGGRPVPSDFNEVWNADFGQPNPIPNPTSDPLFFDLLTNEGALKKNYDPQNPNAWNGDFYGKILRPDSVGGITTNDVPETPEPATMALMGIGLAAAGMRRRWKKK